MILKSEQGARQRYHLRLKPVHVYFSHRVPGYPGTLIFTTTRSDSRTPAPHTNIHVYATPVPGYPAPNFSSPSKSALQLRQSDHFRRQCCPNPPLLWNSDSLRIVCNVHKSVGPQVVIRGSFGAHGRLSPGGPGGHRCKVDRVPGTPRVPGYESNPGTV
eukprot:396870-Rhodomonas_salina.1